MTKPGIWTAQDEMKSTPKSAASLLSLGNVSKTYGSTRANADVTLDIGKGEVLGLIGANGAGKSTLMRIVCGVTEPDSGTLRHEGVTLDPASFSIRAAQDLGIRIVWQELSLCGNLTVAENFYIEQPDHGRLSPFWRAHYHRLARRSIEEIFPDAGIRTESLVGELPIAQRQMVEIARVAADPKLKLLILDEPTSSLGTERAAQLRAYVRKRAAEGLSTIFISHKLGEVLDISDRIVAMRNGRIVWERPAENATISDLIEAMGGPGAFETEQRIRNGNRATGDIVSSLDPDLFRTDERSGRLKRGEIIGLAGLEGSGQKNLLDALFRQPVKAGVQRGSRIRYVSGDRQNEGVFPLWSVLRNITIGRTARLASWAPVNDAAMRPELGEHTRKLRLDEGRLDSNILQLSGGNQQKALVARALVDDFDILLLDDPTRGIDIGAKRDFYHLVAEIAASGKLVIWYSTEDLEFLECDRVFVFSRGKIVRELDSHEIGEEAIVAASFHDATAAGPVSSAKGWAVAERLMQAVPFVSLVAVFVAMTWQNPLVASSFGMELLLTPAVPLVLIALAQMFVVGGSEIDLGAGAFAGLVNVLSATLLVTSPWLGGLALAGGLIGYGLIGVIIHARAVPAIVVTLGASFIWLGVGRTLQPSPGGGSPEWLSALSSLSIPYLPTPLVLILLAALAAFLVDNSALGTVLRGFGANAAALTRAGWSPVRYAVYRYVVACLFIMMAGFYVTASNGASDINASSSFTLLSIAAIVIGGCQLLGGVISPLGVAAGAVTLSLIGALLASLGVSTDYNAAVQGALLIVILAVRTALTWRHRHA